MASSYPCERKSPAQCYPPAEFIPHPTFALLPPNSKDSRQPETTYRIACRFAVTEDILRSEPEEKKEPVTTYRVPRRFAVKTQQPARCYPQTETNQNSTSPKHIKRTDGEEEERKLVGFELHYGMKRKTPARCYPPRENIPHSDSALLPAYPVTSESEAESESTDKSKLTGFATHYDTPRKSAPQCCPAAEANEESIETSGAEETSPSSPSAIDTTNATNADLPGILPVPLATLPKAPIVFTLTASPRAGISPEDFHHYLSTVHAPLAAPILARHDVVKYHNSHNTAEMKKKLLPLWPGGGHDDVEEEEGDWEKIDAEEGGKEGKEGKKVLQGEVAVQLWFKDENGLKGLVKDEEWKELGKDTKKFVDPSSIKVTVGWGETFIG